MNALRYLVINADDFNLTRGVDRAVLECHDEGIVSSTTILMTLPFHSGTVKSLKARPFLGQGVHLSLTLGEAIHPRTPFSLRRDLLSRMGSLPTKIVEREYEAQIHLFLKLLGRLPTHLDTHHHIHHIPNIFRAISALSGKYKIPFRSAHKSKYLFEDLNPKTHWTARKFEHCLKHLPSGISEMMVHPGYVDHSLRRISSFLLGREVERKFLTDQKFKSLLDELNIKLIHFGDLAYFKSLFH